MHLVQRYPRTGLLISAAVSFSKAGPQRPVLPRQPRVEHGGNSVNNREPPSSGHAVIPRERIIPNLAAADHLPLWSRIICYTVLKTLLPSRDVFMQAGPRVLAQPCNLSQLERDGYLVLYVAPNVRAAIDSVFAAGLPFFRQSREIKLQHNNAKPYDGYKELGYSYSIDPERPDLAQSFCVKPTDTRQSRFTRDNEHDALRDRMNSCGNLLDDIVTELVGNLGRYLSKTRMQESPFASKQGSHLQLNYYNPETSTRELLQDPHEDGTFATLTIATAEGLEIMTQDASFMALSLARGELLCMPGDIMHLMTGGRIRPLYHQVKRSAKSVERLSLMYFASLDPKSGATIEPWIKNETNAGVDIMKRVTANPMRFGLAPLG